MAQIHPTAIVADGAIVADDVRIGPFCVVGENVRLDAGVELKSHVVVDGHTSIGERTVVHPQAVLGGQPQSMRHKGGPTRLTIGRDCTIREGVTANVGTDSDRGLTSIGDHCFIMTYAHIAHDCAVGDHVTIVNNVMLAGHCVVGDHAIIGGGAALHQFSRVGTRAFVGGMAGVEGDVIPYGMALGNRAYLGGLNIVGLKRAGVSRADIHALRHAYQDLFDRDTGTVHDNAERLAAQDGLSAIVREVLAFVGVRGKRGFVTPPLGETGADAADI